MIVKHVFCERKPLELSKNADCLVFLFSETVVKCDFVGWLFFV